MRPDATSGGGSGSFGDCYRLGDSRCAVESAYRSGSHRDRLPYCLGNGDGAILSLALMTFSIAIAIAIAITTDAETAEQLI